MICGALFSDCHRYRYKLWRIWDTSKPFLAVCMLNPSIASHLILDPTISRVVTRAIAMNYGGVIITNAYAFRSTYPEFMYDMNDPTGPYNDMAIRQVAAHPNVGLFLIGWGKHCNKVRKFRSVHILETIALAGMVPHVLERNGDNSPKHPLYTGYDVQPTPY